jgi:hypothetical protein
MACHLPGVTATTAALLLTGSPAAAHVLLAKAQPNGDGSTTLTFTFDHGCGDSPTTELIVSLPAGATPASPTEQPTGWKATIAPSRPGLQTGAEAAFSPVTRLTGTIGQPLRFPTVERCANSQQYQWTDPQPGDEHPAPSLIATGAILAPQPRTAPQAPAPAADTGGAGLAQALGALATLVLAAAASAAVVTRRATDTTAPQ